MARRFAKVSEEEIEESFFYPSDLVNINGEELWIYTSTLHVSVYIHHYSPSLRGIVVYYPFICKLRLLTQSFSNDGENLDFSRACIECFAFRICESHNDSTLGSKPFECCLKVSRLYS